jgi:hypothetical protein
VTDDEAITPAAVEPEADAAEVEVEAVVATPDRAEAEPEADEAVDDEAAADAEPVIVDNPWNRPGQWFVVHTQS